MKKLLFRKFLKDTLKFFTLICLSIGMIVWVIQAVGYLDFVTEDGHSMYVYFSYSFYNFPKIISRILPFVFFVSLFYQISQYELKNELLVFWTNGIKKISFINVIIVYSLFVSFFQIFLGGFVSPLGQNEARSFIRESNIDYFPALIKEGKFIDTVSNLTIFIDKEVKDGSYRNIFLKDNKNCKAKKTVCKNSQIIYAKKGILVSEDKIRYFRLFDGKLINEDDGKITDLSFEKIDFNLSKFDSKTTTYPKIQETSNRLLFECFYLSLKGNMNKFKNELLTCEEVTLKNIKQELFKRFYKPIYFPLLGLISGLLILRSKESTKYNRFKYNLFFMIFLIIIISEISLRYSSQNNIGILFFIFFPIITFFTIYISLITKFKNKI